MRKADVPTAETLKVSDTAPCDKLKSDSADRKNHIFCAHCFFEGKSLKPRKTFDAKAFEHNFEQKREQQSKQKQERKVARDETSTRAQSIHLLTPLTLINSSRNQKESVEFSFRTSIGFCAFCHVF
jgi:hypothetical protein